MAFIYLQSKKINAGKRFSSFAKATADKGKGKGKGKGWSSAVAKATAGQVESGEKDLPSKGLFLLLKYRPLLGTEPKIKKGISAGPKGVSKIPHTLQMVGHFRLIQNFL